MRITLILDYSGLTYYGNIPNTPFPPDPRIEEFRYIEDSDLDLLDEDFIDSINETCDVALDRNDVDYFDKAKCIKLKLWLENHLTEDAHPRLKDIYDTMLRYAQKAIELETGIVIEL
ncbi:MAG: hypothetical protein HUK21_06480 [Fibrobacteraceae bacterium]|nr:hypothetical protein [Fibrobacteraceae bacterium]